MVILKDLNLPPIKINLHLPFNNEVETINELLNEAEKLIKANQEGDLSIRGEINKFSGGWKRIIEGVNSILDAISAPVEEAGKVLNFMGRWKFYN